MVEFDPPRSEVRLRDIEDGDLEVFFEHQRDPEAVRRAAFPARDRDTFMAHWARRILADSAVFTQTVVVDGEVAGNIMCWEESGKHMVGYWFGRRYWGRGIATEVLTLFLGRVKIRPLYADPAVRNTGSVRLLEKCGFRRTGVQETRPSRTGTGEVEHVVLVLES